MKTKFFLVLLFLQIILVANAAKVDTLQVKSAAMDTTVEVVVISPEQSWNNHSCPTVYLLHGYGGYATVWLEKKTNLPEIADEKGVFIVCPDGKNSWYFDSEISQKSQFETFVANELVQFIDSNYNTLPQKEKRAVTGLSMGGHGAMFLAMRHTDVFGAAGTMSGGVDFRPFSEKWEIKKSLGDYENNSEKWDANVAINQIERIKNGDLALTIDCGKDDFFMEVNQKFHEKLNAAGIDHDFTIRPGKHTWSFWINSIDYHILFFTNFFNKK